MGAAGSEQQAAIREPQWRIGWPAERFARLFKIRVLRLDEAWAQRHYQLCVRTQEVLPAVLQRFIDQLRARPVAVDTPAHLSTTIPSSP